MCYGFEAGSELELHAEQNLIQENEQRQSLAERLE
jgi:hypothetical protein